MSKMVPKMMLKVIQLAGGLCHGVRKGRGVPCRLIWGSFRGHFGTFLIRSYVVFLVQPVFVVINLLRDCCDVPLRFNAWCFMVCFTARLAVGLLRYCCIPQCLLCLLWMALGSLWDCCRVETHGPRPGHLSSQ